MFQIVRRWFRFQVVFRPLRPRKWRPNHGLTLRDAMAIEQLEARELLYGYVQANMGNTIGSGTLLGREPLFVKQRLPTLLIFPGDIPGVGHTRGHTRGRGKRRVKPAESCG
jgi:hypothetical protein